MEKKLNPIKKLIVNGFEINNKTNYLQLYQKDKAAAMAYHLYKHFAYPEHLKKEVERLYGKQNFLIIPEVQ